MMWSKYWHMIMAARCLLLILLFSMQTGAWAAAPDIQLNAILGKKVIVTVDGVQHTLKEGERVEGGIELKEVDRRHAIFLWDGQTLTLEPSSRISTQFTERKQESITIYQDRSNHYMVTGEVNGRSLNFMVDTGATVVSLNSQQANSLGLEWKNGPQLRMLTAGGSVTGYALHLEKITVQGITVHHVEAVVMPTQVAGALLGMSFLRHFEMTQSNNMLILKKKF